MMTIGHVLMVSSVAIAGAAFLPFGGGERGRLEVIHELPIAPGSFTFTGKGMLVVSYHQYFEPTVQLEMIDEGGRRGELTEDGKLAPNGLTLDSIQSVQSDGGQILWLLDNGRRGDALPKLVGWDAKAKELARVIYLPEPATRAHSFLTDMVVDRAEPYVYLSDPAGGQDAALVVINTDTGVARRVLEGDVSMRAEEGFVLQLEDRPVERRRLDGTISTAHLGVGPIALDRGSEWLYFGPVLGGILYRVRTSDLIDETLDPISLAGNVERYSAKPVCVGITVDNAGNIYVGDLIAKGIGVIRARDKGYEMLVQDPRLQWPCSPCFGPDGRLYVAASQLHLAPFFQGGQDRSRAPFPIFRVRALGAGVPGR
jgi:hypothetical protein